MNVNVNGRTHASARMYWIHALTPLHVGSGRGVSFIDLPIMREKVTDWPIIPGSSVKGVWRDYAEQRGADPALIAAAFGLATDKDDDHAGSLAITDARIVLLPVRSVYGTFAYATSPLVLSRLARDMKTANGGNLPPLPAEVPDGMAITTNDNVLAVDGRVFFEDLDFTSQASDIAHSWAEHLGQILFGAEEDRSFRDILLKRLVIVSNSTFDFLCQQGTEINARIRIEDDKKTVAPGALWYEESLPAESVLAGVVWCERVYGVRRTTDELLAEFCTQPINVQMGGKATVGKGYVRCLFSGRGN
ncbi:MAG: type III-B CRISPR module RAMP protein Cmr4 [Limnochordaceae bacterium]|nr:type III-B CRISPR module RAMP protein Cmr4 [Limnochordaceae bacterium]